MINISIEEFAEEIKKEFNDLRDLVIDKNRKYNNSVLNPIGCFSNMSPEEQILVRMDDKLSRFKRGEHDDEEDALKDLAGYILLLLTIKRINTSNYGISFSSAADVLPQGKLLDDNEKSRRKNKGK